MVEIAPAPVSTRRKRRPPAAGGGGGEEADAEVQVAPHLEAPGAERVHPRGGVVGDRGPGLRVGGQQRVGLVAVRALEPGGAVDEHGVDGLAGAGEPQARTAVADVEDVGVEAVGERGERVHPGRCTRDKGPDPLVTYAACGADRRGVLELRLGVVELAEQRRDRAASP